MTETTYVVRVVTEADPEDLESLYEALAADPVALGPAVGRNLRTGVLAVIVTVFGVGEDGARVARAAVQRALEATSRTGTLGPLAVLD